MIKDLRVSVRLYNNQLRERREALGKSAKQLADDIGVQYSSYCALEAMTLSPLTAGKRGGFGRPIPVTWRPIAIRVAEALGVTPEVLFPDAVLAIEKRAAEVRVNAEEVAAMLAPSQETPFGLLASAERDHEVTKALATLKPRERRILKRRFGIDGSGDGQGLTLEEIGKKEGLGTERIRQIEAKALRKLRHPRCSKRLKPFVEGE